VGTPDETWGEVVTAVVVAREPVEPDALIEHCRTRLAGYKRPRRVRFMDALPRNATGKILKRELRA
jgi:fatty-acyl-CoA synthase